MRKNNNYNKLEKSEWMQNLSQNSIINLKQKKIAARKKIIFWRLSAWSKNFFNNFLKNSKSSLLNEPCKKTTTKI